VLYEAGTLQRRRGFLTKGRKVSYKEEEALLPCKLTLQRLSIGQDLSKGRIGFVTM
jgi:hypothetical protein